MTSIPRPQSPMVHPTGAPTGEWHDFFRRLADSESGSEALAEEVAAVESRVDALEESGRIQGAASVAVSGATVKTVSLVNDEAAPDPWSYYGTDPTGTKGFVVFPDNLQQAADLAGTGFILIDSGTWQQRILLVSGDLTISDDGTSITIGAETYPPELGYGGV